jgi:hypothetical protein
MPNHIRQRQHTCNYCRHAFPTAGGVHRHITHLIPCRGQWETEAQQAQCATRTNDSDGEQDINEDIDLPNFDVHRDVDMPNRASDVPEPDVLEGEHEDTPAAPTVEEGHGPHFVHFAQEFSEKPAADIIGREETPFEQMKRYQEATGRGVYAPFADHEEWVLAQWLIKNVNQRVTEEFLKLSIVSLQS